MPRDTDVFCLHCQSFIPRTRERAHRRQQYPPAYSPPPPVPSRLRRVFDIEHEDATQFQPNQQEGTALDDVENALTPARDKHDHLGGTASIHHAALQATEASIRGRWDSTFKPAPDSGGEERYEEPASDEESTDDDTFDWDRFDSGTGLSAWDQLGEDYERETANVGKSSQVVLTRLLLTI